MAKHLITSALPYINGIKHLGNLVGSMLPSDVYARYLRQTGHEVLLICATDEHGTPAELAAAKAGQEPAAFCAEQYEIQKSIYERFGLSFDWFGRTSRPENIELTQHLFNQLEKNGFIAEKESQQVFSHADNRFLPDRYVEGTCPHCGYDKARGDQCENCGKVLDPTDLLEPRSAISGSTDLEVRATKHLFLRQSALADKLRDWVNGRPWSKLVKSIALKWLDEGLEDRSITRDLKWGVPVPKEGYENKVFYVWFDAPIGYIGATAEWGKATGQDWRSWWYNADDVTYTQFMGKDNIPFHSISFPATLIGSDEPWKAVDVIKGFSWLTYYGGKFSTSQGIGIFTDQALDLLSSDYWRYYLMARVPESDDSAFTWTDFQAVVNKDLADVLGNYVNRLTKFTAKKFGTDMPTTGSWSAAEDAFAEAVGAQLKTYEDHMGALEYRKAMSALREIWRIGNGYLAEQAPWDSFKTDPDRAAVVLRTGLNFIEILAQVSAPIIPDAAAKLASIVGADENSWPSDVKTVLADNTAGRNFTPLDGVLFAKLEDDQVAAWAAEYGAPEDKAA